MILVDWRSRPAAELARCYDAERASWMRRFDWETAENWRQVEQARVTGALPGTVAMAEDGPIGWAFFLKHRRSLQIGGLCACPSATARGRGPQAEGPGRQAAPPAADDVIATLLDAVLASPEAADVDDMMTFTPDAGDGLAAALAARGFAVQGYEYLSRQLEPVVPVAPGPVSFHAGRLLAVADLLGRAYPGANPARPFAPAGTSAEWVEYTSQIVVQTGCGTLLPWASVVEEDPARPGRLVGGILCTRIGSQSAHLAQVAIDPACQRQGRGARLLNAVLARLFERGYTRVSLLVSAANTPALALYGRMGFVRKGAFVSAWRDQPRRSTSAACSTGGVSTLR